MKKQFFAAAFVCAAIIFMGVQTVPAADCLTFNPNPVSVSGTDTTLNVVVTFTDPGIGTIPPDDNGNLVVVVDTACASYITVNSVTNIVIDNATSTATATANITVKGDAPSTQCSISASYSSAVITTPITCSATFSITQTAVTTTTTTTPTTTTTTTPTTDCLTFNPNTVSVSGTDETLNVVVTITIAADITIDPNEKGSLAVVVNTACASYITVNDVTNIVIDEVNRKASAVANITVKGDAPSSQCSISATYSSATITPPITCSESFTITQTTEGECSVVSVKPNPLEFQTVKPAFFPVELRAGLIPRIRRVVITGEYSNWNRTSAVSIQDIKIIIPLRVTATKIFALIVIPSTLLGFEPGEKAVTVATGDKICEGTVTIFSTSQ